MSQASKRSGSRSRGSSRHAWITACWTASSAASGSRRILRAIPSSRSPAGRTSRSKASWSPLAARRTKSANPSLRCVGASQSSRATIQASRDGARAAFINRGCAAPLVIPATRCGQSRFRRRRPRTSRRSRRRSPRSSPAGRPSRRPRFRPSWRPRARVLEDHALARRRDRERRAGEDGRPRRHVARNRVGKVLGPTTAGRQDRAVRAVEAHGLVEGADDVRAVSRVPRCRASDGRSTPGCP